MDCTIKRLKQAISDLKADNDRLELMIATSQLVPMWGGIDGTQIKAIALDCDRVHIREQQKKKNSRTKNPRPSGD